jgi:hypothetical protein
VKLYWTMNSIPELDGLDRKEKRKLFRQMYREGRKRTGMVPYLYFIIAAVLIGVASVFLGLDGILRGAFVGGTIGLAFAILIQSPALDAGRAWYRDTNGDG